MKRIILIFIALGSLTTSQAQTASIVKFAELKNILSSKNDTTYVINFWATWCIPCVKEFPAFQALGEKHKNEKVKLIMVSLDFKKEYDKTLAPFLLKHPINARVMLLDEPDYDSWINKAEKTWQGEIPVTLIVNGSRGIRSFLPRDFTPETLEETFSQTIKQ